MSHKTEDFGQGNSRDVKRDLAKLFTVRGTQVTKLFPEKKVVGDPDMRRSREEDTLGLRIAGSQKIRE